MAKPQSSRQPVVDEDVDDLDDVLEQFTPTQKPSGSGVAKPAKPATPFAGADKDASGTNSNTSKKLPAGLDNIDISDDFAKELAEGMAALMREIAAESGEKPEENLTGTDTPSKQEQLEREASFRKAWEDMLVESMNGAMDTVDFGQNEKGKVAAQPGELDGPKADVPDDDFQASIRKAMEKLKESDSALHADSASGAADPLESLLSKFGDGGEGTEEELQGILESMMTQLMSKEVLYEPLKELNDKFPKYLSDNAATLSEEDKKRYESQQRIVTEIVAVFEDPTYSPDSQEKGVKVVTLMNAMQTYGSPPAEIMGPLPPGMELGTDGMPKVPDGCVIA